ncbi:hypothetical protein Lesp01_35820 [Lentzea sp. NBRC 102530]|nr:hypothetical protein Lesp01_35820 [Lentzea sp. NBRC 102530]
MIRETAVYFADVGLGALRGGVDVRRHQPVRDEETSRTVGDAELREVGEKGPQRVFGALGARQFFRDRPAGSDEVVVQLLGDASPSEVGLPAT